MKGGHRGKMAIFRPRWEALEKPNLPTLTPPSWMCVFQNCEKINLYQSVVLCYGSPGRVTQAGSQGCSGNFLHHLVSASRPPGCPERGSSMAPWVPQKAASIWALTGLPSTCSCDSLFISHSFCLKAYALSAFPFPSETQWREGGEAEVLPYSLLWSDASSFTYVRSPELRRMGEIPGEAGPLWMAVPGMNWTMCMRCQGFCPSLLFWETVPGNLELKQSLIESLVFLWICRACYLQ